MAWVAFAASASEVRRFGGETMGTTWSANVVLPEGANGAAIQQGIQAELDTVVAQMSTYDDASDLSRFNRAPAGTWHTLPPEFFAVLRHALALARDTGGAYDPTVGPLVNLWGFGPGERRRETPSAAALNAARARVGWQRIRLDEATQSAFQPGGVYVDLSSVAKGFGVDQVAAFLDRAGASAYLVEVGGELRAHGRKPDGSPWRVGVERPGAAAGAVQRQDELERVVVLDEKTIATSGDYRHFFEDGGRFFSHHIDPRTGTPVAHRVASVSIVADDGLHADPLGTAMMVLGPEQGLAYAKRHGIAVLFILHGDDGRLEERMSPAFAALAKP
ncbi:FAD:protein FMN transferase [Luteibacter sp. UNCMF366Tsu5.1]|uniref:FAD:protein FMN transferase n=1 Tax=Luteibacter sp. UNCMF366Tsu5.1 TaxID=1502758 RepID=UPI001C454C97|nr:FAD:protein FMN transferase [Luteibacter sp. UNCMF366Tsu5.1]